MKQSYHSNAVSNLSIRQLIQKDNLSTNKELSNRFGTSTQTISKLRNREFQTDSFSAPVKIEYALSELEMTLIVSLRMSSWLPLDEVHEALLRHNSRISRALVYRCFVKTISTECLKLKKRKRKNLKHTSLATYILT